MAEPIKKNLKARPKAGPSRITDNIVNKHVIRDQAVQDNTLIHLAESDNLSLDSLPNTPVSVPLSFWLTHQKFLKKSTQPIAVQIAADEEVTDLIDDLQSITTIVLPFVTYADGRSYSHAYKLRTQLKFTGEIRAIGDVHYDQLDFLARVGFDAFELPDTDNQEAALMAFKEYSEVYQPSVDDGRLVFSRRRAIH